MRQCVKNKCFSASCLSGTLNCPLIFHILDKAYHFIGASHLIEHADIVHHLKLYMCAWDGESNNVQQEIHGFRKHREIFTNFLLPRINKLE